MSAEKMLLVSGFAGATWLPMVLMVERMSTSSPLTASATRSAVMPSRDSSRPFGIFSQ